MKRKKLDLKKRIASFLLLANLILILTHVTMNKASTKIVIIFSTVSTFIIPTVCLRQASGIEFSDNLFVCAPS